MWEFKEEVASLLPSIGGYSAKFHMRILITGHEGFVGRNLKEGLENNHKILTLEKSESFDDWKDKMRVVVSEPVDVIVHAGAIANTQYQHTDIFLWNAQATKYLFETAILKSSSPYFIFFSTFMVAEAEKDSHQVSYYTWSKLFAEHYIKNNAWDARNWCILRPSVMWGDESGCIGNRSIPYRLASRELEHLFSDWGRDYVHITDVVEAVRTCIKTQPKGIFDLATGILTTNKELASLVKWKDYRVVDNTADVEHKYPIHHISPQRNMIPGWNPIVKIEEELPRLCQSF